MEALAAVGRCLDFCRTKGAEIIYLCFEEPPADPSLYQDILGGDVRLLQVGPTATVIDYLGSTPVLRIGDVAREPRSAVIVIDANRFHWIMRWLEPLTHFNSFTVPVDPDWVASPGMKTLSLMETIYGSYSPAAYLGHSCRAYYLRTPMPAI